MISAAILTSACSTSPTTSDSAAETQPEPAFEQQSGTIEAVETAAQQARSSEVVAAQSIQIRADYPREYTVKKGDTLWDISSKFLKDPWYWPEIWHRNPQVENPHLIYPGDILTLIYVNGVPQIQVTRAAEGEEVIRRDTQQESPSGLKVVKLTPNIHRQSLDAAIPSIPGDAIRQFLTKPRVITTEEWEQAPYIVGSDDAHLILGANNKIYIRGELDKERIRYSVYRKGDKLVDPDTGELLGFEIIHAGQARIEAYGQPSSGTLISTKREILIGDRLLPEDKSAIDQLYFPRVPEDNIEGKVISLFEAISSVAKYQIVVINRGSSEGLEVGHLLATYQKGYYAKDKFLLKNSDKRRDVDKLMVQLPGERSGIMMIFKVFDRVSYGLILESTRTIHRQDVVKNPR
ncbi:MAG: LysM peptidoglycan-binding domain-containing protein [Gammaproteobacteria bacterium]|nr:LysM peptidoglycan-binding domain-containing protein [Gammaproteobacteria bacterium]